MLTTSEPIGRFIALANLDKGIISQTSIEHSIENLVDLITLRVQKKSIEEVANGLLDKVFDLRFEVLEWLADKDKNTTDYFESLNSHISVNLQLAPYSDLANTISSVLMAYEQIVSPIFAAFPPSFREIFEGLQKSKPHYDSLQFLSIHPSPQTRYVKKWIDASLQLETGIILADLILTQQIPFPKKRIKNELIGFLLDTLTRFGAYSIFTNFWKPAEDDLSNLTNQMQILAATIELDNKIFHKTSPKGLFNLINS